MLYERNVILIVETEEVPRVDESHRVTVEKLSNRFSRITLRFGFMETPDAPKALAAAYYDVRSASFFLSQRML